jgi:hypothetical protein
LSASAHLISFLSLIQHSLYTLSTGQLLQTASILIIT